MALEQKVFSAREVYEALAGAGWSMPPWRDGKTTVLVPVNGEIVKGEADPNELVVGFSWDVDREGKRLGPDKESEAEPEDGPGEEVRPPVCKSCHDEKKPVFCKGRCSACYYRSRKWGDCADCGSALFKGEGGEECRAPSCAA